MKLRQLVPIFLLGFAFACSFGSDTRGPSENPKLAAELINGEQGDASNTFIQMSDTQFGLFEKPLLYMAMGWTWDDELFEQESQNFEKAVNFINVANPNFVVICGDLVNVSGHQGQTEEFKRISSQLESDIPLYLVSGNHDVSNVPDKESLAQYRKSFGHDWYAFQHDDIYGIVLNCSLISHPEGAQADADAQRKWLEAELVAANGAEAKHILVFQHHPYFVVDAAEETDGRNIKLAHRMAYLELLNAYGVEAVMAGHLHENALGQYKNVKMITTGAIGGPHPLSRSRSGLRVVRAEVNKLRHAFIAIKDLVNVKDNVKVKP